MVLGNNVTVDAGFDGAVVLGNESAPSKPMPVESITIQGTTYRFAGTNPTSTVSVGAEGKERQNYARCSRSYYQYINGCD